MTDFPLIPGYRIEREVGAGGMATVYLAVQERLNRRVAVKVLSPVLLADKQFIQRFLKEAETAANLHHSNIVPIHDVGRAGDHNYIVMEYLEESLKERIKQGPLSPEAALDIVLQVGRGLDYAHAEGFVHRDIKPENIMFRRDGTPVLTDFGIARAVDSATKLTKTGMS
ncbi:MAG: serine/threonine protein kinase, partial [Candidatus Aminicenantes bacterium]|nr:serine/threonine protein kinase [Candidatus Aminicenantes bacterium]